MILNINFHMKNSNFSFDFPIESKSRLIHIYVFEYLLMCVCVYVLCPFFLERPRKGEASQFYPKRVSAPAFRLIPHLNVQVAYIFQTRRISYSRLIKILKNIYNQRVRWSIIEKKCICIKKAYYK